MTLGLPPSITATQLFVVPKSIPITLAIKTYPEILKIELDRVQAIETGDRAASMFSLDNPPINWCKLSESMGVPAYNPKTVKEFTDFFNK